MFINEHFFSLFFWYFSPFLTWKFAILLLEHFVNAIPFKQLYKIYWNPTYKDIMWRCACSITGISDSKIPGNFIHLELRILTIIEKATGTARQQNHLNRISWTLVVNEDIMYINVYLQKILIPVFSRELYPFWTLILAIIEKASKGF